MKCVIFALALMFSLSSVHAAEKRGGKEHCKTPTNLRSASAAVLLPQAQARGQRAPDERQKTVVPPGKPPANPQAPTPEDPRRQSGVYSNFTKEDLKLWEIEQNKLIQTGHELFHNDKLVGGTTGVACAMCHPDGSNTHPETYPKYQVQLQRVAMLRDMINWCLMNPLKAPMLKDEDPKMKALEAYIISKRKGHALEPGKH